MSEMSELYDDLEAVKVYLFDKLCELEHSEKPGHSPETIARLQAEYENGCVQERQIEDEIRRLQHNERVELEDDEEDNYE